MCALIQPLYSILTLISEFYYCTDHLQNTRDTLCKQAFSYFSQQFLINRQTTNQNWCHPSEIYQISNHYL